MNYLLVLHGHPPIIIHEEDRKEYYAALEAWNIRQNLAPLRIFLKSQAEKTWERQILRLEGKTKRNEHAKTKVLSKLG